MTITQLYICIYYKRVYLLQTTILLCVELKCVIENISIDRLHQYFINFECKIQNAKRKKQKYYSILRTIFSNWNILFGLELTTCLSNVSQNPLVLNGDYPVKSLERLPPSSSKNPTARPCATGDRIFPTYLVFRPPLTRNSID